MLRFTWWIVNHEESAVDFTIYATVIWVTAVLFPSLGNSKVLHDLLQLLNKMY